MVVDAGDSSSSDYDLSHQSVEFRSGAVHLVVIQAVVASTEVRRSSLSIYIIVLSSASCVLLVA